MAAWKYQISLLVLKKYFTHWLHSLVKYFSTLEEKFGISALPCNILYFFDQAGTGRGMFRDYVLQKQSVENFIETNY